MADDDQRSEYSFKYNCNLACALAQYLPFREKKIIQAWITKLRSIIDMPSISKRNEYMWFLLNTIQHKRIPPPFTDVPYDGELRQLKNVVPPDKYEEILNASMYNNFSWVDDMIERNRTEISEFVNSPPNEFLNRQPKPQNGIICYMGAFSDQR